MPTNLSLIYIISIIFLISIIDKQQPISIEKSGPPQITSQIKRNLRKNFNNKQMANLLMAYTTGNRDGISRKIRMAHQNLALLHLFTPSGIHLASLFVILFPMLMLIKKYSRITHSIILLGILTIPVFMAGYYSIKRISMFKVLSHIESKIPFKVPSIYLFYIAFSIDFFLGSYSSSPGSFIYSFLFLGIIISQIGNPKILLPFALLGGQIIISNFQNLPLTTFGFLFGFLLTLIFSLFFPLFLVMILFYKYIPSNIIEHIVFTYWQLVDLSSLVASKTGYYHGSIPLIISVTVISLQLNLRIKCIVLICLLLVHSAQIS